METLKQKALKFFDRHQNNALRGYHIAKETAVEDLVAMLEIEQRLDLLGNWKRIVHKYRTPARN